MGAQYLNLFAASNPVPKSVSATLVDFENIRTEKSGERRGQLQGIVNQVVRQGMDACVVHGPESQFDIAILSGDRKATEGILARWKRLDPRTTMSEGIGPKALQKAWQNRVRIHLGQNGFMKIGYDRYVSLRDIHESKDVFKRGFRVQAVLLDGRPAVFVDSRSRVMEPLVPSDIERSERDGDESEVKVRVLPRWAAGILHGRAGRKAGDVEFPLGNKMVPTRDYWRIKNNVPFVADNDEMVSVYLSSAEKAFDYPVSCVFREFRRGMPLPSHLKKEPALRVQEAKSFIEGSLSSIEFLRTNLRLDGPSSTEEFGYEIHEFPTQESFSVRVGGGRSSSIKGLLGGLKANGPWAGQRTGRYVVVHAGVANDAKIAFPQIEKAYADLGFGTLSPLEAAGENGLVDVGGRQAVQFTTAITQLRETLEQHGKGLLAFIVLPSQGASDVYYKARDKFFEHLFGMAPVPVQSIYDSSLRKIAKGDRQAFPIAVNTAS